MVVKKTASMLKFPLNLPVTVLFGLPLGSFFAQGQIIAQRRHVCHFTIKSGRGTVIRGHYPKIRVEQLE